MRGSLGVVPAADPLDPDHLQASLLTPGGLWTRLDVVSETGSTNVDLAARARAGEASGTVLVADHQTAARGRQGRSFLTPDGASVIVSLLVRPHEVAMSRWTWLPLLGGLAVVEALRRAADVPALLKWPNDVLIDGQKICGILAERVETPDGPSCVIGLGLNVYLSEAELPVSTATSLQLLVPDRIPRRDTLIITILRAFELLFDHWQASDDDAAFAAAYEARSATVGRRVRVILAGDRVVEGEAEAIDHDGQLIVRTADGLKTFSAGDVIHLR